MSWTRIERLEFINAYEKKYGVCLSEQDEMLPIMHFIFEAGKSTQIRLIEIKDFAEKFQKTADHVSKKINPKTYHFAEGEAWKWQMGIAVNIFSAGLIIILTVIAAYMIFRTETEIKNAEKIIESSPYIEKILLKNVNVDQEGNLYLKFNAPKDTIRWLTDYTVSSDGSAIVYLAPPQKRK